MSLRSYRSHFGNAIIYVSTVVRDDDEDVKYRYFRSDTETNAEALP